MLLNTVIITTVTTANLHNNGHITFTNYPVTASILLSILVFMILFLSCLISDIVLKTNSISYLFNKIENTFRNIKNLFVKV